MTYSSLEKRRENYNKNKDEINRKRRERNKLQEFKLKQSIRHKIWRNKNKERLLKKNRDYNNIKRKKSRKLVFENYGKKCECCGESNIKFLTIDHINGGGRKHRKEIKGHLYSWLVKNNFPNGFQVLCYNCNCGKRINNGICPHKDNVVVM